MTLPSALGIADPAQPASVHTAAPAALLVAHPGHELRVHRWLELYRPLTFILTDGSGHGEVARIDSSRRVLRQTGARPSSVFGRWSDREVYRILLEGRAQELKEVVLEVAEQLVASEIELLASDAVEGFNPTHDLCYVMAESAALIAGRRMGRAIRHLDFPLEAAPNADAIHRQDGFRLELGDEEMHRKLDSARAYEELREEVDRAFASHSTGAFRLEVLSPAEPGRDLLALALASGGSKTHYESFGEKRVAAGTYRDVLRLEQHWLPLATAIRDWARDAA